MILLGSRPEEKKYRSVGYAKARGLRGSDHGSLESALCGESNGIGLKGVGMLVVIGS